LGRREGFTGTPTREEEEKAYLTGYTMVGAGSTGSTTARAGSVMAGECGVGRTLLRRSSPVERERECGRPVSLSPARL
jgi:hypothetical protein